MYRKKEDLSKLMDRIIDWEQLGKNMKNQIDVMLKIDDSIMKNNDVIFHQISTSKYDNIYTNVIKK